LFFIIINEKINFGLTDGHYPISTIEQKIKHTFLGGLGLNWAMASSFLRFLDHTQRSATVGRIPLDQWSHRPRDLYLTTHNTHNI